MMRGMRMRGGVKPQDVGQTVRRLMSYVARYRLRKKLGLGPNGDIASVLR